MERFCGMFFDNFRPYFPFNVFVFKGKLVVEKWKGQLIEGECEGGCAPSEALKNNKI